MPLLKGAHLAALTCWCGLLLYLPVLIGAASGRAGAMLPLRLARLLYVAAATPAAMIAIATGTMLFLAERTVAPWLVAKLVLVSGMALCHLCLGLMILRTEQGAAAVGHGAVWLGVTSAALIGTILWLALAKVF